MYFPRAFRRFFIGYLLLHLLAAVLFVWVLAAVVRTQMKTAAKEKMNAMALMLREHVAVQPNGLRAESLLEHVESIGNETGYRFTLIDSTGEVTCDSRTGRKDIGPHGDRPEISAAKKESIGFAERYSETLKTPMLYLAIPSKNEDGFIRVAISAESINSAIGSLQKYTWLFAIAMSAITSFLMMLFSSKTLQPLKLFSTAARSIGDGQYDQAPKLIGRNDEWGQLSDAFQQMQKELRRRELKLTENNARLEAVLSSMIEGVFSVGADGRVRMANQTACDMLSLEYRDLVGKPLIDVLRIPELSEAIAEAKSNQTTAKTEFETKRRLISARVSVMGDQENPPLAIVLYDVTELRQLETMRKDFVANVSHELKTPLASIKAYAETLRLGAINDKEKNIEFVEQIEKSAETLNEQIRELLSLARIESQQANFEFEPIDVGKTCEESIRSLAPIAQQSNIEITFENEGPDVIARADNVGLQTIVNNLLTNAINYTSPGGSVAVEVFEREQWAIIQVRDTGIGIPVAEQARVFERFYRVDKARSRDEGGTGLGLAIVKHLSMAMGGRVSLNSQIGKGSVFEVQLPRDV